MRLEQRWVVAFVRDLKPGDTVRLGNGHTCVVHHVDNTGTLWPTKSRGSRRDYFPDADNPLSPLGGIVAVEINEAHPDYPSDD